MQFSKKLIQKRRICVQTLRLLNLIIDSFASLPSKGIPLGNVTSQLFSNIYLNELDQFVKRKWRIKYYIRYADDFVILSRNREELESALVQINNFLQATLVMTLHPKKITFQKWHQGVDFLGYKLFPHYTILRTKTKRRMIRKVQEVYEKLSLGKIAPEKANQSLQSYLGMLKHCHGNKTKNQLTSLQPDV